MTFYDFIAPSGGGSSWICISSFRKNKTGATLIVAIARDTDIYEDGIHSLEMVINISLQ